MLLQSLDAVDDDVYIHVKIFQDAQEPVKIFALRANSLDFMQI